MITPVGNQGEEMMTTEKKKGSKKGKVLWWVLFLTAAAVFLIAGYQLVTTLMEYKAAENEYEELEAYVTLPETAEDSQGETGEEVQEDQGPVIDFASLKAVNEDVVGWLYVEALGINYPIMQGEDNDYYLHRTTEETYNFAGSIFLDYVNKADFSDCNSIVYGHNMKDGSMFGRLKQFREKEVYETSMYFWVCTPEKNYKYEIFSAYETEVGSDTYLLFDKPGKEFVQYMENMKKLSEIPTGNFAFTEKDHVVTLSTCTGNSSTRFVVQGVCISE
ncbi:MAG: class B sortase [Ruminococcus sp.]